jgi:hypothetical protein
VGPGRQNRGMDYAQARDVFCQPGPADAAAPGTAGWQSPARALRDAIEPIAAISFWSKQVNEAYTALGLNFLTGYAWARGSILGEPEGTVVAAAFGVFEPGLIADLYDQGRQACSLADVRAAKESGSVATLADVLGDTDVEPVVAVLRRAAEAADPTGRPLHAGLTAVPWPELPLGRLWHACTMLREHRGDGHLAACVSAGLTGLEANLMTEAWVGWEPFAYTGTRGWSPEAMQAGVDGLAGRGLMTADGALTADGTALREQIEQATDRSVARAVAAAGDDLPAAVARLDEWSQQITEAGWFPPDPYKRASG